MPLPAFYSFVQEAVYSFIYLAMRCTEFTNTVQQGLMERSLCVRLVLVQVTGTQRLSELWL